jgi:hypothetical protein
MLRQAQHDNSNTSSVILAACFRDVTLSGVEAFFGIQIRIS